MERSASIADPSLFYLSDPRSSARYYGGDQVWLPSIWMKRAGCGPCAATLILYYMASRDPSLSPLFPPEKLGKADKSDFIGYACMVWQHLTPGKRGVDSPDYFIRGALDYARSRDLSLKARYLEVPPFVSGRAPVSAMADFIMEGLSEDSPVAFLNHSNGDLPNLDSWHWVTIASAVYKPEEGTLCAVVSDQGQRKTLDLALWRNTSLLGGGFVYFEK